jgi:hypothetical protein
MRFGGRQAVEDMDHSRTKTKSRQLNGIAARLRKTMAEEIYRIAFRKTLSFSIEAVLDDRRRDQKLS